MLRYVNFNFSPPQYFHSTYFGDFDFFFFLPHYLYLIKLVTCYFADSAASEPVKHLKKKKKNHLCKYKFNLLLPVPFIFEYT